MNQEPNPEGHPPGTTPLDPVKEARYVVTAPIRDAELTLAARGRWILSGVLGRLDAAEEALAQRSSSRTIRVPEDQPTIQEAVDAASPGDRILVSPREAIIAAPIVLDTKGVTIEGDGAESNLATYARDELERAGLFDSDSDYGGMLGDAVLEVVRVFSRQGHSGHSAFLVTELATKLMAYQPITPLTYEPDEWNEVSEGLWQNKRKSDVFSHDCGQTWYCLDGTSGTREEANRNKVEG